MTFNKITRIIVFITSQISLMKKIINRKSAAIKSRSKNNLYNSQIVL